MSFLNIFAASICVLEIFAQIMAAVVFAQGLWIAWIDNTAGEAALRKGYGKDPKVNGILASYWALAARRSWSPEFNRVSSEANISDAVSRGNLRHARQMGWSQLQVPADDVIAILAKAAGNLDYANSDAVDDMLRVSDFLFP